MENIVFIIFCFFTILPLTTLCHELGHFFVTRLFFIENVTVRIGSGKEMFRLKVKDLTVVLHIFPYGGTTFFELNKNLSSMKQIILSLGGPLLNGCIAFFLLLPGLGSGDHYITIWFQWLALFNLWMCVMNLIPYKIGLFYSDGWVIVKVISENLRSNV